MSEKVTNIQIASALFSVATLQMIKKTGLLLASDSTGNLFY